MVEPVWKPARACPGHTVCRRQWEKHYRRQRQLDAAKEVRTLERSVLCLRGLHQLVLVESPTVIEQVLRFLDGCGGYSPTLPDSLFRELEQALQDDLKSDV